MRKVEKLDKQAVINLDLSQGVNLRQYPNFAYHILPYLAIQRPTRNESGKFSASSVVSKLKASDYSAPYGEADWDDAKIPGKKILEIWKFLHLCKAKDYMVASQVKATDVCSGVPLVLYAYKHQHDINYNDWDRSDPNLAMMLTSNLRWLLGDCAMSEITDIKTLTEEFLTTASTGVVNSVTNPKASHTTNNEFNKLPKYMRYMYLQTWIYHPSIRSKNMITDWNDWDAERPARGFDGLVLGNFPTNSSDLDW